MGDLSSLLDTGNHTGLKLWNCRHVSTVCELRAQKAARTLSELVSRTGAYQVSGELRLPVDPPISLGEGEVVAAVHVGGNWREGKVKWRRRRWWHTLHGCGINDTA